MNDIASASILPPGSLLSARQQGRSPARREDKPHRRPEAAGAMGILVVDDQPSIARVTEVALGLLGCRTLSARTTADAARLLGAEKVDAIFLDLNLKGESGLEFLSELTALDRRIPVVIFTARFKGEFAEEAQRRGAFGILTKPYNLDDLRRQLTEIQLFHGQRGGALITQ